MNGYTDFKNLRQGVAELDQVLMLGPMTPIKARVQVHVDTSYADQSSAKISTLIDGQWVTLLTLISATITDGRSYAETKNICIDAAELLVTRAQDLLS